MSTSLGPTPFRLDDGHQLPAMGLGTTGMTGEDKPRPSPYASSDARWALRPPLFQTLGS